MTSLINTESLNPTTNQRSESPDRRQTTVPVTLDQRVQKDRRQFAGGLVPVEFTTYNASIVMLALLESLADTELAGHVWSEAIVKAHELAVGQYNVPPELFMGLVERIMEVKEKHESQKEEL